MLYHRTAKRPGYPTPDNQVVIPQQLGGEALRLIHDTPLGGHMACHKLYLKVRNKLFWPRMYQDIQEYVNKRWACLKFKRGPLQKLPLHPKDITHHLHRVIVDFIGPIHTTSAGNTYILVMIDVFTKFAVAESLRSSDAKTTARVLVDRFVYLLVPPKVSTYLLGVSDVIVSD